MVTLVKFGGSLITDKKVESSFRENVVYELGLNLVDALFQDSSLQIVLGHGSGAFGHFAANRFGTFRGVSSRDEWLGFSEVASVAGELNYLVFKTLHSVGLPLFRFQPSASALSVDGNLVSLSVDTVGRALAAGLVPLLYGDAVFDAVRGGAIVSTESLFFYLVDYLPVSRIFLIGDVPGVYGADGKIISRITPSTFDVVSQYLGGSGGVDVTGGMYTKVRDMLMIITRFRLMTIRIFNLDEPNLLRDTLLGKAEPGTLICAD